LMNSASASLDKSLPTPLYHQLKIVLIERLSQGCWKPDQQLPTEGELGIQFGVSKATVRHALRELADAGLIRREQGRGTFASDTKIQFGPRRLNSFTDEMRQSGMQSGSRLLAQMIAPATDDVASKLQVPPDTKVFILRRLRLADGEPMGVQTVHIPESLVPGIQSVNFEAASLYETLQTHYGLSLDHASQKHFAIGAGREDASLLGVPEGSAALGGERLTFLRDGRPLELTYSVMRGDRYQIQLKLVRGREVVSRGVGSL